MASIGKDLEFLLVRKAKKEGGDLYKCVQDPDFSIYFPQNMSRNNGVEHKKLKVTVSVVDE